MPHFMQEPTLTLKTMEAVREVIKIDREQFGDNKYSVRSEWIVSLIKEVKASGAYAYNATVKKAASEALGLPVSDYSKEGDTLSLLIYNAQQYARSDAYREAGYEPLTQDLIDKAFHSKMKIEYIGDTMLGDRKAVLVPRSIKSSFCPSGDIHAMLPKSRKYHIPPQGQPAKLVK